MKKIASILSVAALGFMVACGPSAADKEAKEKKIADSLAALKAKASEDSIANAMRIADSLATIKNDSIRKADSIAAFKAGKAAGAVKGGSNKGGTGSSKPTQTTKDLTTISNSKGAGTVTKSPEQMKKDENNLKTIKGLKGGN